MGQLRLEPGDFALVNPPLGLHGPAILFGFLPQLLRLLLLADEPFSELEQRVSIVPLDPLFQLGEPSAQLLPLGMAGRLGLLDSAELIQQQADRLLAAGNLGLQPLDRRPRNGDALRGRGRLDFVQCRGRVTRRFLSDGAGRHRNSCSNRATSSSRRAITSR